MRIAVMGSGGVGGYFGARLVKGGADVHFVARGSHFAAMRDLGLSVEGGPEAIHLPKVNVTDDPGTIGPVDLVMFCVKLWDTESAARQLLPIMKPETGIISFQNGVTKDDMLRPIFGDKALLGGVAYVGTTIGRPGVIAQTGPLQRLVFGEYDGRRSPRVEAFYEACKRGGINAEISDDVRRSLWEKYVVLVAMSGATTAMRSTIGPIRTNPLTRQFLLDLAREIVAVGRALGVDLPADFAETRVPFFDGWPPEMSTSMHHDLQHGKPLEVRWLSGGVVDLGAQVNVPTPMNRAVRDILTLHVEGGSVPKPTATTRARARAAAMAQADGSFAGMATAPLRPLQLEQLHRIGAADLEAVGLADVRVVEPLGGLAEILERIVDREHDPVGAELGDRVEHRGRAEVARRGDVKVGAEIIRHALLRRVFVWRLHPAVSVVDAPQVDTAVPRRDGRERSAAAGTRRTGRCRSAAGHARRSRQGTPRSARAARGGPRNRGWSPAADCADADRTERRDSRPRARTAGIAADRSRPRVSGDPTCEKPLTSAPLKPSSLTQRCSSAVACSGSCIGSAATPTKRSGRLAISCASTSLASRATSTARATSWMAWIAGALSDAIMISMPASSIRRSRLSWKSSSRGPSSDQTWAPNTCESASVALVAK